MEKEEKDKVRTFFFVHDSGLPIISKEEMSFQKIEALLSTMVSIHSDFICFMALDNRMIFLNLRFVDRILNLSIAEYEKVLESQRMLKGKLIDLPSL